VPRPDPRAPRAESVRPSAARRHLWDVRPGQSVCGPAATVRLRGCAADGSGARDGRGQGPGGPGAGLRQGGAAWRPAWARSGPADCWPRPTASAGAARRFRRPAAPCPPCGPQASAKAGSFESAGHRRSQTTWQPRRSEAHHTPDAVRQDSRSRLYLVRVERRRLAGQAAAPGTAGPAGTVASTEGPAPHGRGTRRPQGRPPHQDPGPRIAVRPPRTRTKTYFCRRIAS
jgi:hypothetical protein